MGTPTMICIGIFVMACYSTHGHRAPSAVNSYCAAYQRVIRSEEEGAQLGRVESRAVRERIAANETLYACECHGVPHDICRNEAREAAQRVRAGYE